MINSSSKFSKMAGRKRVLCKFCFLVLVLKPTIASPQGESILDPLWGRIWKSLGIGIESLPELFRGFSTPDGPTLQPIPEQKPKTTPDLPEPGIPPSDLGTQYDPGTQTPADSFSPLPWGSQQPATGEECGQNPPVEGPYNQCKDSIRMIIYALDCQNSVQNAAITGVLAKTIQFGVLSTTVDDDCGIRFWTGDLTEEGTNKMRSTKGVLAVVPDLPMAPEETYPIEARTRQKMGLKKYSAEKRNRLKRRQTLVKQTQGAYFDLSFISTPPGSDSVVDGYSYFSSAGEGTTVYVFDTGANPLNNEFSSGVIKGWIFSSGARKKWSDEHGQIGHGSCAASKVAGVTYGVAKKASLIVVKYAVPGFISSFLDGLVAILNDLLERERAGEDLSGYNVINSSIGLSRNRVEKYTGIMIELLITIMIEKYRIIYVCGAGDGLGEIDTWPAILSPKLPIIVVGGVYPISGTTADYSRQGPSLTVSAPWQVVCASRSAGDSRVVLQGTAFAASMVAGLAAYFLSLPDLGPILRRTPHLIPQNVKQYIVDSAYIRPEGTEKAIWNKIHPDTPPDYQWVP